MTTQLWSVGLVLLGICIGAFGPILLKKGASKLNRNIFKQLKNHKLQFGITLYVTSAAVFIPALRGGELSVLYPLVSLSYVLVSLLSIKFLGEKMSTLKWISILFIMLGVSLIGLGS
ncbi:hypothetical protein HYV79_02715 [Candidatus Woesearchaeota archaeon]|nr:hypothetical protein [Candidatus Woesearchaeota archaeon]